MKDTKGITLIALIVTIILMLILTGIILYQMIIKDGLLNHAKNAVIRTEYEAAKEIVELELMDIQAMCTSENKIYTLQEIAKVIKGVNDITIEKYYNEAEASIKEEIIENLVNLNGIVVSVNEYSKYKFLIGETGKIEKVSQQPIIGTTEIEDFQEVEEFEKEILGQVDKIKEEPPVSIDILTDLEKFKNIIQDEEKLTYIIEHPEIFIVPITQDINIATILLENEKAINLIIQNNEWRNKILEEDTIQALDNSGVVNLPTTNLQLYNSTTKTGNVVFSNYLRNDKIHSPINAFLGGIPGVNDWESSSLPAYIGHDFGEGKEVWIYKVHIKPGNNTAPTKMYLQSSEDNLTWETIYEFTKYTTPMNETIEVIQSDKNNKKSRYWRLYITESINKSYVDLLKIQFYGK